MSKLKFTANINNIHQGFHAAHYCYCNNIFWYWIKLIEKQIYFNDIASK